MHIFIPCSNHLQSFKTISAKLYDELISQSTHYLYNIIETDNKVRENNEKETKNSLINKAKKGREKIIRKKA